MSIKTVDFIPLEETVIEMPGFVLLCKFRDGPPSARETAELFFNPGDKRAYKRRKDEVGYTISWEISTAPLLP